MPEQYGASLIKGYKAFADTSSTITNSLNEQISYVNLYIHSDCYTIAIACKVSMYVDNISFGIQLEQLLRMSTA